MNLAAANAEQPRLRWYVSEDALPGGLLSNVMYRTTALVLKRVRAAGRMHYLQSSGKTVYLDRDFYLGVFPLTFGQQRLIVPTATPFYTNEGENLMRAAVKITYNNLRGANYPADPTADSILGKLRTLSGLAFDLPGDTEWEYAATSGLPKDLWPNGKPKAPGTRVNAAGQTIATDANFPGRYKGNSYPEDATSFGNASANWPAHQGAPIVGSYEPSVWGFYDMLGCVWEYPREIVSDKCYIRGGAWSKDATGCLPSTSATSTLTNTSDYMGARVACPVGF